MRLSELIERLEQERLHLGLEWRWTAPKDDPVNQGVLAKDRAMGMEIAGLKRDLMVAGDYEVGDLALAAGASEG